MRFHDRASSPPFFQRPFVFWLILIPMVLLVAGLVGAVVARDRTTRAALSEEALRYDVQAAVTQAEARRLEQEQARHSLANR